MAAVGRNLGHCDVRFPAAQMPSSVLRGLLNIRRRGSGRATVIGLLQCLSPIIAFTYIFNF
jgi:hypothetical protein